MKYATPLDRALAVSASAIDMLSDEQRIELRKELISNGITELPRNLYFNYETQRWIEGDDFPSKKASG